MASKYRVPRTIGRLQLIYNCRMVLNLERANIAVHYEILVSGLYYHWMDSYSNDDAPNEGTGHRQ